MYSAQQREIIEAYGVYPDDDLCISAVAGAGKTTLILALAETYPSDRFLMFTYSSQLRLETVDKVRKRNLANMEVHTFHSFGVKYIHETCSKDLGLFKFMDSSSATGAPRWVRNPPSAYDTILVDECQDMTELYQRYLLYLLGWNSSVLGRATRLVLLGDKNQSIFQHNGSSPHYFLFPERNLQRARVKRFTMNVSFRCPSNLTNFLNHSVLKDSVIYSSPDRKDAGLVEWIECKDIYSYPAEKLLQLLTVYRPEDIFVLGPSIRGIRSPICHLVNQTIRQLNERGVFVHVSNDDDQKLDREVIRGKLVFSTFHKTKGLERKCVVLFGILENGNPSFWQEHLSRDPDRAPEIVYTAMTRSKSHLVMIRDCKKPLLPFYYIAPAQLRKWIDFSVVTKSSTSPDDDQPRVLRGPEAIAAMNRSNAVAHAHVRRAKFQDLAVTDLARQHTYRVLEDAFQLLEFERISTDTEYHPIVMRSHETQENGLVEYVADLTGICVMAYYEWKKTRQVKIARQEVQQLTLKRLWKFALQHVENMSKYRHRKFQTKKHSLTPFFLKACSKRLDKLLGLDPCFEIPVSHHFPIAPQDGGPKESSLVIRGSIDVICTSPRDPNEYWVFEIKFTQQLETEHFLQLGAYAWLHHHNESPFASLPNDHRRFRYFLFNVRTFEIFELKLRNWDHLKEMMMVLVQKRWNLVSASAQ